MTRVARRKISTRIDAIGHEPTGFNKRTEWVYGRYSGFRSQLADQLSLCDVFRASVNKEGVNIRLRHSGEEGSVFFLTPIVDIGWTQRP